MGFWSLLEVASMPVLEILIISLLGAFMATGYCNLLTVDARKSLNKIVFFVFTPSLMFASLAKTVTLEEIISWWFMPVNIGLTFLVGGILGWILVKLLRPKPHLEGLVIATCSAGNLGNLLLIVIPAVCDQSGSPFGDEDTCSTLGLAYASFSMALGGFFIWTYTYHLIRSSSVKYKAIKKSEEDDDEILKSPNTDFDANGETSLLAGEDQETGLLDEVEDQTIVSEESLTNKEKNVSFWSKVSEFLHKILEELLAPPTIAAILGFIFGAVTWLRDLIVGDTAPLHVVQDTITLLGEGTIPCITLILGGNLTQGFKSSKIRPLVIIGVIVVRYLIQPIIGIGIVTAAGRLGFLPSNSLFKYTLMVQFTIPPAMNIGTMTQLFDVGQEECSVLFFWTYLIAALALTIWSTIYMWILS